MENLENRNIANQVNMTRGASGSSRVIETGSYTVDPVTNATMKRADDSAVQLLQRGYIVSSENGGPIDVSEVIERIPDEGLTEMFSKVGGLYYGKKVFVKDQKKYYYFSKGSSTNNIGDDDWKPIE